MSVFTNFKIKVPLTPVQAPKSFQVDLTGAASQAMINSYGVYFREAAAATRLPVAVLYTIAMIEQTGKHFKSNGQVAVSGKERSTGIMQVSPDECNDSLSKELSRGRINQDELTVLNKYLTTPIYIGEKISTPANAATKLMYFNALKNVEFNIMMGAVIFRKLLEETAMPDGTMRLDKAIIKYNIGEYSAPTKTTAFVKADTTALMRTVNPITKEYIAKAVGVNGGMYYYFTINNIT